MPLLRRGNPGCRDQMQALWRISRWNMPAAPPGREQTAMVFQHADTGVLIVDGGSIGAALGVDPSQNQNDLEGRHQSGDHRPHLVFGCDGEAVFASVRGNGEDDTILMQRNPLEREGQPGVPRCRAPRFGHSDEDPVFAGGPAGRLSAVPSREEAAEYFAQIQIASSRTRWMDFPWASHWASKSVRG